VGVVRFLLACVVVGGHLQTPIQNIGALAAVQVFFVLSGVYMTAVYSTKYSRVQGGQSLFYINRFLRLWPAYIILLGATFAVFALAGNAVPADSGIFTIFRFNGSAWTLGYILPASFFLFGQDILSVNEAYHALFPVRQSWSIATELLFYVLVPLVFRKRFLFSYGLIIVAASIAFKCFAQFNLGWRYSYFFPFGNLWYFLLGCYVYYVASSEILIKVKLCAPWLSHAAIVGIFVLVFCMDGAAFEDQHIFRHLVFIGIFAALVAVAFDDKESKISAYLGSVSYGVYLSHYLIIVLIYNLVHPNSQNWLLMFVSVVSISVAFSALVERFVQGPVDRFRRGLSATRINESTPQISSGL
jgi:peptidoglycan/LPS O-acetylase OafA/YrhL